MNGLMESQNRESDLKSRLELKLSKIRPYWCPERYLSTIHHGKCSSCVLIDSGRSSEPESVRVKKLQREIDSKDELITNQFISRTHRHGKLILAGNWRRLWKQVVVLEGNPRNWPTLFPPGWIRNNTVFWNKSQGCPAASFDWIS